MTLSIYPLFRLTPIRTAVADIYFNYNPAGHPRSSRSSGSTASKPDGTSPCATRRALAWTLGRAKHLNAEVRIAHYSNGNLLPQNVGIQVPLTLTFGYAF